MLEYKPQRPIPGSAHANSASAGLASDGDSLTSAIQEAIHELAKQDRRNSRKRPPTTLTRSIGTSEHARAVFAAVLKDCPKG